MPRKYCPKCGRITNCNFIPDYCAWGCGSIKDQPLLDKDINTLEYLKKLRKQKEKEPVQMNLFTS